jgi:hypothetical protein
MAEPTLFIEGADEAEIRNAMLDYGYSSSDWEFMVTEAEEVPEGTILYCEFDTNREAQIFILELDKAGFWVEVKPYN